MTPVTSIDARSGAVLSTPYVETDGAAVAAAVRQAVCAAGWLDRAGRDGRARMLAALAAALEARADDIVTTADMETALGSARLTGELARTCFQLRFQGDVAREGSYLDVAVDRPADGPLGPTPDLRRTGVPIGPVVVFGPSNFPLAFGVLGGDTSSALAAGCPVIAKAHGSQPLTSGLLADIAQAALRDFGAPAGVLAVIFGRQAGLDAVDAPAVAGIGFTGSLHGGRALADRAAARPVPVPFHGELGSVNPLVVTAAAAAARGSEIGSGLADSMTVGMGQFCTKPGLFLIPDSAGGDALTAALTDRLRQIPAGYLLNDQARDAFRTGTDTLLGRADVQAVVATEPSGRQVWPVLVQVEAARLLTEPDSALLDEYFGPFAVLVRYRRREQVEQLLAVLPPALTGTLHAETDDPAADPDVGWATAALARRSGRLVFNGYPTGVAVTWAMHHGGPYPASSSAFTSVGAGAIERWIRPVTYQNAPADVLPDELSDAPARPLPRHIDGTIHPGGQE